MKKLVSFTFFFMLLMSGNQMFGQAHKDDIQLYFNTSDASFSEYGDYIKVSFFVEGMYNSSKPYLEKAHEIQEIEKLSIKNMPNQYGQNESYALLEKENYQVGFTKLVNTVFKEQNVKAGENKEIIDIMTFLNNNPVKK